MDPLQYETAPLLEEVFCAGKVIMIYFILPFRPETWQTASTEIRLDPQGYVNQLETHWPGLNTRFPADDPAYALRWSVVEGDEVILYGGLQEDLQSVAIEPADRRALAAFVIWHRSVIPSNQELFLTWEGVMESLELTEATTAEDINDFTGLVA